MDYNGWNVVSGVRNGSTNINSNPEVIQMRPPEAGQHSTGSGSASNGVTFERTAHGLPNINNVNKGSSSSASSSSVVIGQNGLYGYTDLPQKEFGHVSGNKIHYFSLPGPVRLTEIQSLVDPSHIPLNPPVIVSRTVYNPMEKIYVCK